MRQKLPYRRYTSNALDELSMEARDIGPEHTDASERRYNETEIEELAVVQAEIDELVEGMLAEGEGSLFPGVG